jgi:hypothetical protein
MLLTAEVWCGAASSSPFFIILQKIKRLEFKN